MHPAESLREQDRPEPASLTERLDQLPLTRFHWKLLLLSGFGWMFAAMDILIVGSVVAAVSREWHLDASTSQWINSVNIAGLFFGALASGWLADRLGRKTVFQATLLVYALFTGLSALAAGPAGLMLMRFLAGLGLGGELPVASTLVSEFAPAKKRGMIVVLLESFWAYGSVLAALIGFLVVPGLGWRAAFVIGALPALYVLVLRRNLPESPRFLLGQGKVSAVEGIVREIETQAGVLPAVPHLRTAAPVLSPARARVGELFSPAYLKRTLVLWALWAAMNFSYYGIFLWLPTQFVRKGFTLDQALLFNLIITLAQIPGYFSAAYFVEKIGRKATLIAYLLGAAVGAFFFGQVALQAKDIPAILGWGCVISFFNLGAWGVVYTYTPELYPTWLRATGAGWAAAVGRLFAFIAPLSIAYQISLLGNDTTVFTVFTLVMVLGGGVVLAFGPETQGRSLEAVTVG